MRFKSTRCGKVFHFHKERKKSLMTVPVTTKDEKGWQLNYGSGSRNRERGCWFTGAIKPAKKSSPEAERHNKLLLSLFFGGKHAKENLIQDGFLPKPATKGAVMRVVHECCAGFDVHKKSVYVCILRCGENGDRRQQVRSFGTITKDLLTLADWLKEQGVTHVAMEATGVYWRPVWAILEGQFQLLLVNPHHIKALPGRKTDVKDCEWIADLLQHGLLRGSFVPPTEIQDLRDLTRYRAELTQARNRIANRIQKLLEQANVKLSSVASNTLGVSGRQMIEAIISGEEDPVRLAELAKRRMRSKIPELQSALQGRVRDHHRFLLKEFLDEWNGLGARIAKVEHEIKCHLGPFQHAVNLWQTIPGMDWVTASNLVAEIGVNMEQFPTAEQLASWAGLCPGNDESAGKRKSGKTRDGNRWLKRTLCQASWAVTRKKNCYLAAQFRRIAAKRGMKRALIAVAHTMLIIAYTMLKTGKTYEDLGGDYLENVNKNQVQRYLVRRLQTLGFKVTLEPVAA